MVETQKIDIKKTPKSRLSQINFNDIPFGKVYADHMFMADYKSNLLRQFGLPCHS